MLYRFAREKVNFGLNTDDPCIIDTTLNEEFAHAQSKIGLTEDQVIASIYNAAKSCFLSEKEKADLIKEIDKQIEQYRKSSDNN